MRIHALHLSVTTPDARQLVALFYLLQERQRPRGVGGSGTSAGNPASIQLPDISLFRMESFKCHRTILHGVTRPLTLTQKPSRADIEMFTMLR